MKSFLTLSVALPLLFVSSVCLAKHKMHQNSVIFEGVTNVEFTVKDYTVSNGQPVTIPLNTILSGTGNAKNTITFGFGRHKTKQVADKFNKQTNFHSIYTRAKDDPPYPGALNASIHGKLCYTIDGMSNCQNVVIGQGSVTTGDVPFDNTHDNWWFGFYENYAKQRDISSKHHLFYLRNKSSMKSRQLYICVYSGKHINSFLISDC